MSEIDCNEDYKAREEAMKKIMEKVQDTKISKAVLSDLKKSTDKDAKMKCDLSYRIFHEGMEMYESGQLTFKEFVADLNKTLLAIE